MESEWSPGRDLTHTLDPVAQPAFSTGAVEAPRGVDTGGMEIAVMGVHLTLVHICTQRKRALNVTKGHLFPDYLRP